jgi:hypothetical protein
VAGQLGIVFITQDCPIQTMSNSKTVNNSKKEENSTSNSKKEEFSQRNIAKEDILVL